MGCAGCLLLRALRRAAQARSGARASRAIPRLIRSRSRSWTRGSRALHAGRVHVELLATRPARARAAVARQRRTGRGELRPGDRGARPGERAQGAGAQSRRPVRPRAGSTRGGIGAGTGRRIDGRGPLAQGRCARCRRQDRRRRPRVQRVPPQPGHGRPSGIGGQGRLLRDGRLRRDEPRHGRRRDRGRDGARREALPRLRQGRRRARPGRRLRERPRDPDHQPLRQLVQHRPR